MDTTSITTTHAEVVRGKRLDGGWLSLRAVAASSAIGSRLRSAVWALPSC